MEGCCGAVMLHSDIAFVLPLRRFCHFHRGNRQSAHGVETEKEVFDELLSYGRQALDRFSSIVDTTSRCNMTCLYSFCTMLLLYSYQAAVVRNALAA